MSKAPCIQQDVSAKMCKLFSDVKPIFDRLRVLLESRERKISRDEEHALVDNAEFAKEVVKDHVVVVAPIVPIVQVIEEVHDEPIIELQIVEIPEIREIFLTNVEHDSRTNRFEERENGMDPNGHVLALKFQDLSFYEDKFLIRGTKSKLFEKLVPILFMEAFTCRNSFQDVPRWRRRSTTWKGRTHGVNNVGYLFKCPRIVCFLEYTLRQPRKRKRWRAYSEGQL